jgi:large conductance mechanosensitive channel
VAERPYCSYFWEKLSGKISRIQWGRPIWSIYFLILTKQNTMFCLEKNLKSNAMSLMKDFKAFALRGNVVDLAVAVVIGAAFGRIVTSLVSDVIMPPLGLLIGGVDFSDLVIVLQQATGEVEAVTINYGIFIKQVVDFVIIAFVIFMVIRAFISMRKKEEVAPTVPPAPTKDQQLLTEIRDLLKTR